MVLMIQAGQEYKGDSVIDWANIFFLISILQENQSQFEFVCDKIQYLFTMLPQGYLSFPTYVHNLVRWMKLRFDSIEKYSYLLYLLYNADISTWILS